MTKSSNTPSTSRSDLKAWKQVPELQATATHIVAIQAKLDLLNRAKGDSWAQILTRVASMYKRGELKLDYLYTLQQDMASSYGTGYAKFWDRHMPMGWQTVKNEITRRIRATPNGPEGSWHGPFPITLEDVYPPHGTPVVYVLFDASNEPAYVGSSAGFRSRVATHFRDRPELVSWAAWPCRDREHAYQIEDNILRRHLPYMNRKASR